jgi:hypothetical protein
MDDSYRGSEWILTFIPEELFALSLGGIGMIALVMKPYGNPRNQSQTITPNQVTKEGPMKRSVVVCALALLIGWVALKPTPVHAAGWLTGADAYAAPWVKEIEQELLKKDYSTIYANDPRAPQVVVLRTLNEAAKAQAAEDSMLAQQFVRDALSVFEEGVRKHYYLFTVRYQTDHNLYPAARAHQAQFIGSREP